MTSGSEPLAGEPRSGNPPAVLVALYWRRLPVRRGYRSSDRLAAAARRFQSGVVNDYVTWIVLGLAGLGGVLALVASRLLRNLSAWLRSTAISIMVALGS